MYHLYIYFTYVVYIPSIYCLQYTVYNKVGSYNCCDEDIPLDLVFFSPFEELLLQTAGIMESKGIHRVYEP